MRLSLNEVVPTGPIGRNQSYVHLNAWHLNVTSHHVKEYGAIYVSIVFSEFNMWDRTIQIE